MLFPAIDLNGMPLWGFTYRLITEWLGLLPKDPADASFQAARALLDQVVAHGCPLAQDWADVDGAKVASVRGRIPTELVLAQICMPGPHFPPMNMLAVRPDSLRMAGLMFEEYIIRATA